MPHILSLRSPVVDKMTDISLVIHGGLKHDFALGGVDRFRILGIEPWVGLDPTDVRAFVTGLWFTDTGLVTMRQVPIASNTEAIPAPGAFALLSIGLAGLGFARRKLA